MGQWSVILRTTPLETWSNIKIQDNKNQYNLIEKKSEHMLSLILTCRL